MVVGAVRLGGESHLENRAAVKCDLSLQLRSGVRTYQVMQRATQQESYTYDAVGNRTY
jgi:hypothetical protein